MKYAKLAVGYLSRRGVWAEFINLAVISINPCALISKVDRGYSGMTSILRYDFMEHVLFTKLIKKKLHSGGTCDQLYQMLSQMR